MIRRTRCSRAIRAPARCLDARNGFVGSLTPYASFCPDVAYGSDQRSVTLLPPTTMYGGDDVTACAIVLSAPGPNPPRKSGAPIRAGVAPERSSLQTVATVLPDETQLYPTTIPAALMSFAPPLVHDPPGTIGKAVPVAVQLPVAVRYQ